MNNRSQKNPLILLSVTIVRHVCGTFLTKIFNWVRKYKVSSKCYYASASLCGSLISGNNCAKQSICVERKCKTVWPILFAKMILQSSWWKWYYLHVKTTKPCRGHRFPKNFISLLEAIWILEFDNFYHKCFNISYYEGAFFMQRF